MRERRSTNSAEAEQLEDQPYQAVPLSIVPAHEVVDLEKDSSPLHPSADEGAGPTKPDEDPFSGFKEYLLRNMPESAKARARASGGNFYTNRVYTCSSSTSNISSPRDPKATVFPIPIADDEDTLLGFLDDEGDNILPQSKRFDSKAKKKMVAEMVKCAPEGYTETLRG